MRRRRWLLYGGVGLGLWILGRSKPAHAIFPELKAKGATMPPSQSPITPTKLDTIYREECSGIPVEYLQALAHQESRTNPGETKGACWGLLQVCPTVLKSYNERFDTSYRMGVEMLEARLNVRVACELISRIPRFYVSQHPKAFPGGFSWSNRRHVDLLTMGWNAGWSESRGVAGAIGTLLSWGYGPEQVTVSAISRASQAGRFPSAFTAKLGQEDVVPWVRRVSALYFQALRRPGV
jgi:hypothetical protein